MPRAYIFFVQLIFSMQLFYVHNVTCALWASIIQHEQDQDIEESDLTPWVAPTHLVPRIECEPDTTQTVSTTFMFLVHGSHKMGPSMGYQPKYSKKQYETCIDTALNNTLPKVLINEILNYIVGDTQEIAKEIGVKSKNSWYLFEEHIVKPSLKSSITEINPIAFYKICFGTESIYEFFKDWISNPQHSIIKTKLKDLQKLADLGRAFNPYSFTIRRNYNMRDKCLLCGEFTKKPIMSEGYSDYLVHLKEHQNKIEPEFSLPSLKSEAPCSSCSFKLPLTSTTELITIPKLLMALTPSDMPLLAGEITKKIVFNNINYQLITILGLHMPNPKKNTPFIQFFDQQRELCFFHSSYQHAGLNSDDFALAALYQLEK